MKKERWSCEVCGYKQDFEPTKEKMHAIFHLDDGFMNMFRQSHKKIIQEAVMGESEKPILPEIISENMCPNCAMQGNISQLT